MDKSAEPSDEDTITPMRNVKALGHRRPTVSMAGGGPRKSIAAGALSRGSMWSLSQVRRSKAQEVKLENTYRTEPRQDQRLSMAKVRSVATEAIDDTLNGYVYNPASASAKVVEATQAIREQLKDLNFDRYKFVVFVVVSQKGKEATFSVASRAIWSVDNGDSFVEAEFSNHSVLAVATVHCFYFE